LCKIGYERSSNFKRNSIYGEKSDMSLITVTTTIGCGGMDVAKGGAKELDATLY